MVFVRARGLAARWSWRMGAIVALAGGMLVAAGPSAVLAECTNFPVAADGHLDVGYAFTARVAEASRNVDPPSGGAPYDWHVVLVVDDVHLGDVPDRLVYNGWTVGCHELRGDDLRTGDRLFIAAQHLRLGELPTDPIWGDVAAWRRVDGGWRFDERAMAYGASEAYYPAAVREARTTAEILAIVRDGALPPTDAAATSDARSGAGEDGSLVLLLGAFGAGLALAVFVALMQIAAKRRAGPEQPEQSAPGAARASTAD